ncbi:hydroxyacid dehydrogenase [Brachybacterium sp. FME24]|uniref:hydroxyacid dehydrogenase n=1 Tax=Brachybacterium sp. FME24 TaxID=2742605 RepID=UPI0018692229|nr:hydroxyacid dehydrogenase [Brachybacterium sp. FME24]
MTTPAGNTRIFVAITPEESDRLYDESTRARLAGLGEVTWSKDGSLPADLADAYDVLITSWSTGKFAPEAVIGERLRLAVHTAGTIRGLFPRSVLEQGLRLAQGGSAPMAVPVAELSLTLTLALLRNLHWMDRRLQATRDWSKSGLGRLTHGIREQSIGIVGLSRTGREYASMVTGLGVQTVRAFDPYVGPDDAAALGVELVDLAELCATSDVLAIHAPVTEQSRHMLDQDMIGRLRDGAIVVNTARSAVIDMEALSEQLVSGRLSAGLDVFDVEPLAADSPLYGLDNVLITPHVAGGTIEARFAQGAGVTDEIVAFLSEEPMHYEVTADIYDRLS